MRRNRLILSVCALALMIGIGALAQQTKTNAPAAATAPTKPADKSIRFHFDGIPYGDVLERFAQMAAKPLVSDTNVQGTLTFNDQRPYTYQEALDTLNVMLSMKGVMLIEDGNYLRLVPFKQLPQVGLKILRGLEQAGDIRPGEIVTVVLDMKNLDSKEVADAVQAMVSNAGSIAPLSRGRGLIITDRLANIQRIRSLLNAIDTEAVADRQMKAFTLLHASGAVVADLINRTFGLATAPKRTQYNPNNRTWKCFRPTRTIISRRCSTTLRGRWCCSVRASALRLPKISSRNSKTRKVVAATFAFITRRLPRPKSLRK